MSIAFCFWLLMILHAIFGVWSNWTAPPGTTNWFGPLGGSLIQFILLALIGYKLFGPPLHP